MYNLMVLDDENIIRRGICMLTDFKALGIDQHFEAQNGQEALGIMAENKIDIILADINMPKMDGLEFAKKAKVMDPAVKIALMTGYDYLDYAISAIKIGVDDYILKPVSKEDIHKLLFRLIEKKRSEAQSQKLRNAVEQIAAEAGRSGENNIKTQMASILEAHIKDPDFSLNKMAQIMGYSISYLSTQFKKHFGENFRDYLLNLRLERAKILILSTAMKNYEIAAEIGIEDPNYLSACFKRRYHMTIKAFRTGAQHGKKED